MNENGRQIRGYAKKRQHKNHLKNRYKRLTDSGSWFYYKDQYYKTLTLSVCRGMCKKQTNRRLRRLRHDVIGSNPSAYRKVFDYWWTLF